MTNVREQWNQLPEGTRAEIVNGVLHLLPSPAVIHAQVVGGISNELTNRFERALNGPGGWVFLQDPNVRIGDDIYEPDIAGWHRDRFAEVPSDAVVVEVVPNWVCEVLSPSTKRRDRTEKLPNYFRQGVDWVWLVAPRDRIVEVYRRGTTPGGITGFVELMQNVDLDGAIELPPFETSAIDLDWIWAR
jgi:Uma2 family endonuclease